MGRGWALAGVSEDELQPVERHEPPQTPHSKWKNFWYHNKWYVFLAVFFTGVIVFCTVQLFTRVHPDYRIVLATKEYLSPTVTEVLGNQLAHYGEDLNGDGKVQVQVEAMCLEYNNGVQHATITANSQKFIAHLAAGKVMLFALDQDYYEQRVVPTVSEGYLFFDEIPADVPLQADGTMWDWNGSDLQNVGILKDSLPTHLWFGVRRVGGAASGESSVRANEAGLALLARLAENRPTQTKP